MPRSSGGSYDALFLANEALVLVVKGYISRSSSTQQPSDQPAPAQILTVNDTSISQLYALSRPVDPGEIKVQQCLNDAECDGDRKYGVRDGDVLGSGSADYPVEQIKEAVGAKGDEVEAVEDSWDGGLAQEKQLRENSGALEGQGEAVDNLWTMVSDVVLGL